MKRFNRTQWLIVILAVLTVAIGVITNFATAQTPTWVRTLPWLPWAFLGGLAITFIVVSLLQAREPAPDQLPSTAASSQPAISSEGYVSISPYIVGPPIENPTHFFGRSAEIDQFFAHINAPQPQSLQILGLRRAGKTSFLRYVSHPSVVRSKTLDSAITVVSYVDLQVGVKSPSDFYLAIAEGLVRPLDTNERPEIPTTGFPTMRTFEKWLDASPLTSRRLIILLDEFEALHENDDLDIDFFKGLRSLVGSQLAWVITSYRDLYRLSRIWGEHEKTSPLFNVFHPTPIFLAGLAPKDADDLIQKPAALQGVYFAAEELVAIQHIAGPLPFFLQAAAEQWFKAKLRGLPLPQAEAEVKRGLAMTMDRHFSWYWTHFTDHERAVLIRAAKAPIDWSMHDPRQGNAAVHDLIAYGILMAGSDGLRVAGSVFADWIRACQGGASQVMAIEMPQRPCGSDEPIPKEGNLLFGTGNHLTTAAVSTNITPEKELMKESHKEPSNVRVFISYSSQDKNFTDRLASDLELAKIDIWYDTWEIGVGDSIISRINAGLRDSDYLMVVLSPASVASTWVQQELNTALMAEFSERNIVVLPVLYRDCEVPPLLRNRRYADFRSDYAVGLQALLDVLGQESTMVPAPSTPPILPCRLLKLSLAQLRRVMNQHLTLEEVRTACFDLKVDFDNLAGQTKNEKIIEFILYLDNRGRMPEFIEWVLSERSDLC